MKQFTYKGFIIVGKTDSATFYNNARVSIVPQELTNVAEIYYADGGFMQWVSSPRGILPSVMGAKYCIDEYLNPHDEYQF